MDISKSVMSAHEDEVEAPVLTDAEKEALRVFVQKSIQIKKQRGNKEEEKKLNETVKAKRAKLLEYIRSQREKCFMVPKDAFKNAELRLSGGGLPTLPPFVRIQKNTSDAAITPQVAETAILNTNLECVEESPHNPVQTIVERVVDSVRNIIRSTKESIVLSPSMEKGLRPIDIPDLPENLVEDMVDMHASQQTCKKIRDQKRKRDENLQKEVKQLQPIVQKVLDNAGKTSQQLNIGGATHRIVKQTSRRGTKITLKMFENTLSDCLGDLHLKLDTLQDIRESFGLKEKKQLVQLVLLRLNELPQKASSSVKLVMGKDDSSSSEEQ